MLNCELQDLMGRVEFSRAEISCMEAELSRTGVEMPQFRQLGGLLADQGGGNRKKICRALEDIVRAETPLQGSCEVSGYKAARERSPAKDRRSS